MKDYKAKNGPNRLHDIQVRTLDDKGTIALVVLDTDHGRVSFAVNRTMAEFVRAEMTEFLEGRAEAFPRD